MLVFRMRVHKVSNEGGSRGYLSSGPIGQKSEEVRDLGHFIFRPVLKRHVLLAEGKEPLREANGLITHQNLPNVQLSVLAHVSHLSFLFICTVFILRISAFEELGLSERRHSHISLVCRYFPPELGFKEAVSAMCAFHVLVN